MRPDTIDTLKDNDLVAKAQDLLQAVIKSTNILEIEEMKVEDIQKAKIVLGFLNSTNSLMKTKLNVFRMTDVGEKVKALEEQSRRNSGKERNL